MDKPSPTSDDISRKPIGEMTRDELLKEATRQQAERNREEAEIRRLGIGHLIDVDKRVGDDFFEGDTEEERDGWVRRGGNFPSGYGVGSKQQHNGQNKKGSSKQQHTGGQKEEGRGQNTGGNAGSTHSTFYNTINLVNSDIEEITNSITEYCNRYSVDAAGNDSTTDTTSTITNALPGMLFENHIDLSSSEKLIRNFSNAYKEFDVEAMIKNLNDVYLRGSRGEEIQGEYVLSRILADIPGSNVETANELLNKIKRVFRRRKNDALSQLPEYIRNVLPDNILHELQTNVVEVLSPKSFNDKSLELVVAHLSSKTIRYAEIYINDKEDKKANTYTEYKLVYKKTIINVVPTKIIKYENPITTACSIAADTILKYDITFESYSEDESTHIRFNTGPATIEEILSSLRLNGHVYNSKAAEGALTAVLNAYYREERMEIKSQLKSGFYLIDGKVQAHGYTQQKPTKENIIECIKLLDNFASRYKRPEIFPSVIKWGMIAPFSYVLKQLDDKTLCLQLRYDHGETHAGKTTNGQLMLCIWRIHDLDHEKPFNSVNTEARMGYAISESTFPMLINEVPDLNNPKYGDMIEAIKNSVYDKTFRSRVEGSRLNKYHHFLALRQFYFTGNPSPPDDTAFQRRIFPTYYSLDDVPADKKEFETLLNKQGHKLGTLGDFTAHFVLNNNECLKTDWRKLTTEILTAFYKEAGMEAPFWVNLLSAEDHLEDVIEAQKQVIRGALGNLIEGYHSRNYNSLKNSVSDDNGNPKYQQNETFQDRLNFCLEKDLISFLKKKNNKIIILADVVTELKKCKVDHISGLPQLQSMIGGHSKLLSLKVGNNERKQKVISVDLDEFLMFVNPLNYCQTNSSATLPKESWDNTPKPEKDDK